MTADRILAVMLALAPHDNPARMQPIAETIERAAEGITEESMLLALWIEGGPRWDNPFQLRTADRRTALGDWRVLGRLGLALDAEASLVVRRFRMAFRICPNGVMTWAAQQLAYAHGRARCVPTNWDRTVADRAAGMRPLLSGQ